MKTKLLIITTLISILISCENSDFITDNNSIRPIFGQSENVYRIEDFSELTENQLKNGNISLEMDNRDYYVVVKINDGELILAEPAFEKQFFKFSDGKLEMINKGEFGGALNFIPNDESLDTFIIWEVPTNFVFNFKDKTYFMVGVSPDSYDGGAIFELKRNKGEFDFKEILRLDSAPQAIAIYKNKILIAGNKKFTVVEDFKKENIVEGPFWDNLDPISIAVSNEEEVYVGMKGGYSKISLKSKEIKYYKYIGK